MNNKKAYVKTSVSVIYFEPQDVVTASDNGFEGDAQPFGALEAEKLDG